MSSEQIIRYDEILGTPILPNNLVTVQASNNVEYHFDIYTLVKAYVSTGKLENPYTREPLSTDIVIRVKAYMRVDLVLPTSGGIISFNGAMKVYEVILEILVRLRGDVRLCISTDVLVNNVSLYTYDLNNELSSLNLPKFSKVGIATHIKPIYLRNLAIVLEGCDDTHKPMLGKIIRKHLRHGDIVYYT